jgi:hypothetical protein
MLGKMPENNAVKIAYAVPYGTTEIEATQDQIKLVNANDNKSFYILYNAIFEKELWQSGLFSNMSEISSLVAHFPSNYDLVYDDGYTCVLGR